MNTTAARKTPAGTIAIRGNRELHLLGNSVEQQARINKALASHSFDRLFKAAKPSPGQRNVRYIKVAA